MLLLNDLRNVQEMKAPSSLDHNYKWLLFPYQGRDLLLMIIYEPAQPAFRIARSFGFYNEFVHPAETMLEPIESVSLSRAAEVYSQLMEEQDKDITPRGFADWVICNFSIRIKHKMLDIDIEDDSDYPFLKLFSREDYNDQGLHAVANALTSYFHTLFSQSKAH